MEFCNHIARPHYVITRSEALAVCDAVISTVPVRAVARDCHDGYCRLAMTGEERAIALDCHTPKGAHLHFVAMGYPVKGVPVKGTAMTEKKEHCTTTLTISYNTNGLKNSYKKCGALTIKHYRAPHCTSFILEKNRF